MKIKNYTNEDCCLNCDNFSFWDGDYCCVSHLKIHQYGFDINHYPYMNEDIDNTMKTSETCEDYSKCKNDWILEEYKKYKELQKLCKNLENFVN